MARERRRIWKENITIKLMMINEGKNEKMKKQEREKKKGIKKEKERKIRDISGLKMDKKR